MMIEALRPTAQTIQDNEMPRYKMMLKDLVPRLYQETIISSCVNKNCLVVLPTGMGKTVIALMLASQRLNCFPNSKMLFLAPTRPLVEQHLETFKKHFDISEEELAVFTGFVKPEKREEIWKKARIIFSTSQGLENDIISNRINLEEISLLVFDEAHRATGDYSYNFIAKQYNRKARYPRILALTASPGSEIEKIDEVCRNLFIEDVELRTDSDPDVLPYIQQMIVNTVKVDLPADFKKVHKHLKDCYNSKLNEVRELGKIKASEINNGKTQLLRIQGILHSEISKGDKSLETLKSVSLLAEAMKTDHAIELLETQGIDQLNAYFDRIYSEAIGTKVKAVKNLANDINFKSAHILTKRLVEEKIEHPKLPALKKLVENEILNNREKKIIIFSQFRDSAKKIHDVLSSIEGVKAEIFVGQAKKNGLGLTQKKQKELLGKFSLGEFNCLIATSVAEEGIDIPCVDLVVFYEPIPSGIRSIQRRGRTGRQEKGKVIVLVTKETRDEGYKWSAFYKEKRMYRELEGLRTKFKGVGERQEMNLNRFISPETEIKIFADAREKASGVIKELIELGVLINLKTLAVGDYLLSERVGVEYKKIPDFVDSIVDGRLLEQIKNLKHNFEKPLLILEGEEDIYSQRGLHPNAIRGMLAMITVSYGIPLMYTKNSKETAALMAVIAKREQDPEFREFNPHGSRKPLSLREQQEYIVSSIPGVGPGVAKSLLAQFGSVRGVFNADAEELQEVDNVGEKRAKEVQRVLGEGYEKDKNK
jgi:Fanconi anemia group M protein